MIVPHPDGNPNHSVHVPSLDWVFSMHATREVICEVIYRRREQWNAEHPNKALGLRDLPLDELVQTMWAARELHPDNWRHLAALACDALGIT